MAESKSKQIQVKEPTEVSTPAEQTKSGPVFVPAVDIFEDDTAITLLADIPGAKAEDFRVDLHDNILTLDAEIVPPEGKDEIVILREYETGRYFRQFTVSQVIDQSKIDASLKDGVLRLTLPKVAPAVPRKIAVKAG